MTPEKLAEQCVTAMNFWKGEAEKATITIALPKGWKRPAKFPRGELLCVNPGGQRLYSMNAMNVLAWLAANGLVNVEAVSK